MKILFITRGFPDQKYKTLGIFEYEMAKALVNKGHQVIYVALDFRSIRKMRRFGVYRKVQDGIMVEAVSLPLGPYYKRIRNLISRWFVQVEFEKLKARYGTPDVIHTHFAGSSYFGARLKVKTGIPLVVTEHSSKLNRILTEKMIKDRLFIYKAADLVTAVSSTLKKRVEDTFDISVEILSNVVDTDLFNTESRKIPKEFTYFVSTGNLILEKGMEEMVLAFHQGIRFMPRARLFIFGDGPQKKLLVELIRKYELQDRVILKGIVSKAELKNYYEKASAFVLASHSETFGVSYIEALAMGLPVIATKCGGPSDYVHDANGLWVAVNNQEELSEALVKMYGSYSKYEIRKISEEIKKRFGHDKGAQSLEEVYNRVMKSGDQREF